MEILAWAKGIFLQVTGEEGFKGIKHRNSLILSNFILKSLDWLIGTEAEKQTFSWQSADGLMIGRLSYLFIYLLK
jgi:hypothetical protein